jgi:type II secretion system protein J
MKNIQTGVLSSAASGAAEPRRRGAQAFTLLEILLGVSIFAVVLIAINTVFFSAMRLQQRTTAAMDENQQIEQALAIMRCDLRGTLPPAGKLASSFKNGLVGSGTFQSSGLEFFTTTGILTGDEPWSEVQKVVYQLMDPLDRSRSRGRDLVRSVTRNLLSTAVEYPEEQRLAENIESMEFLCHDGVNWRGQWDTSLGDTNLPSAVKVRILMAREQSGDILRRQPLEMVVALTVQTRTNATTEASSETGSGGGGM